MISLKGFTGEFPRSPAHLLPDNAAKDAVDCDFTANVLTGLHDFSNAVGTGVSGTRSAFFYAASKSGPLQTNTFAWSEDADVVRGPIANDAYDRMYWTTGGAMQVTRYALNRASNGKPGLENTFAVGVPAPTTVPVVSAGPRMVYGGSYLTSVSAFGETSSGAEVSVSALSISTIQDDSSTLQLRGSYTPPWLIQSTTPKQYNYAPPVGFTGDASWSTKLSAEPPVLLPSSQWAYPSSPTYEIKSLQTIANFFTKDGSSAIYAWQGDYATNPLPATMYCNRRASFYDALEVVQLTYIGNGWYCSDASATNPDVVVDTAKTTLAVKLYFGNTVVILRESEARSTFPIAGYSGEFVYDNGTITVNMRTTDSEKAGVEARAYVYTYVNIFGEEGPPSAPVEVTVPTGKTVTLVLSGVSAHQYAPINKLRLYRTATGSQSTEYLFVNEFNNSTTVRYTDNKLASSLGEPLSTLGYRPPETGLRGLTALPNGVLVAFKNNELHFCEPYLPYAWKAENILTTADTVIGVCAAEGGFYVTTRSVPYFVSGLTPDAMSQQKISSIQAGVSKGSICNMGSAVVYASNDGLVAMQGLNASLDFSFRFFTRNDWRKRYGDKLDKMRINAHDGHMVVWFEDGTPGFMIRFDETEQSFTKLKRGFYAAAVHPKNDELYVCLDGSNMVAFKNFGAPRRPYSWTSKDFVLPKPASFGGIRMLGSGSVTVRVYADDELLHTAQVVLSETASTTFRIPPRRSRRWSFALDGQGEVVEFDVASTFAELANA